MRDIKVTLVQADQKWEDKEGNFENYINLLQNVDSDLILLPEMFNTCFSMNTEFSESMDGKSIAWLKELAKNKNSAVYTSLMIEDGDGFYNRGVFIYPDGRLKHYDKRKTFGLAGEDKHFNNGVSETIVDYEGWKFQLQICYDLRFPEIVRNEIIDGRPKYDVILYVANWPEKRSVHWKALLNARAIENQSYVFGVNRFGSDDNGIKYSGDSLFADALGKVIELPTKETVQSFVIKLKSLTEIREKLPFLIDR